jgi:SH3 domain protein
MATRLLVCVTMFIVAGASPAETAYITDMLRLGLHEARDTSDQPFRNLASGAEVEVLQRVPNYAEVRTEDGDQGWVKSAFLVTEKPALLIVDDVQTELDDLRGELELARAAQLEAEAQTQQLLSEMTAQTGSSETIRTRLERLESENQALAVRMEAYRGALPIRWVAVAVLAALVGGIGLGLWILDAHIRRRHAGFRVY